VLDLSRAMAYKACAELPLGGGTAVNLGDPQLDKTDVLLRAYGRFVESWAVLTAPPAASVRIGRAWRSSRNESCYVTGRPTADGGAGDSSVLPAYGVACGMRAAAAFAWNEASRQGRRMRVLGVGKVGERPVEHLLGDGASVVVAHVDRAAAQQIQAYHPGADICDTEKLFASDLDVFVPCAMGGVLDDDTAYQLQAEVVCRAAHNQLAHAGVDELLWERGVRYAPDSVVNDGGLMQMSREVDGYDMDTAKSNTERIFGTLRMIFETAAAEVLPTTRAADAIAERRISVRAPSVADADRAES
jgi:valine dehydrogenase (NAD+)